MGLPLALTAAPYLAQALFGDHPQMPGPSPVANVKLPDRSGYQNQILSSGFDPHSELYRIATERAMANINNNLANRGMGNSSMGVAAQAHSQSELANAFLESELQRRIQAFQAATGYDIAGANVQMGVANAQNADAWKRYDASNKENQQMWGGIQGLFQAGASAYGGYQQQGIAADARAQAQANFDKEMFYKYGAPYSSPQKASTGGYIDSGIANMGSQPAPQYGLGMNTQLPMWSPQGG